VISRGACPQSTARETEALLLADASPGSGYLPPGPTKEGFAFQLYVGERCYGAAMGDTNKGKADGSQVPTWPMLRGEDREQYLTALRDWVDTFLRVRPVSEGYVIPDCWPAHNEAVWELATLHAEWVRVYSDPDSRSLDGALEFQRPLAAGCPYPFVRPGWLGQVPAGILRASARAGLIACRHSGLPPVPRSGRTSSSTTTRAGRRKRLGLPPSPGVTFPVVPGRVCEADCSFYGEPTEGPRTCLWSFWLRGWNQWASV
jgi:hypothetical protein